MTTVRWGIVGTGAIAHAVAGDFQFVPGAELAAVASRTKEKAQEFAARHGVKHAYGSYRELLESSEVDVVYISTPHPHHRDVALAALGSDGSRARYFVGAERTVDRVRAQVTEGAPWADVLRALQEGAA